MIDAHKRQYWQRSNVEPAIRGASAALLTEFAADITRGGERGLILCSGQFVGAQAHRAFGPLTPTQCNSRRAVVSAVSGSPSPPPTSSIAPCRGRLSGDFAPMNRVRE